MRVPVGAGKGEAEGSSAERRPFGPDAAALRLHNCAADRQIKPEAAVPG